MTNLCYVSASEALRFFVTEELSPVELMPAIIDHVEKVEGTVNAVVEQRATAAIRRPACPTTAIAAFLADETTRRQTSSLRELSRSTTWRHARPRRSTWRAVAWRAP